MRKSLLGIALVAGLVGASLGSAAAQQLVSIKGEKVNMRAAPGGEVLWQLGSGYPLKVLQRRGSWLHVVDFEDDKGWVARRLTSSRPHYVVKSTTANIRSGPGTRYRVLGQASYGEVFKVLEKRQSWVRVQGEDRRKGWIARRLLWGW